MDEDEHNGGDECDECDDGDDVWNPVAAIKDLCPILMGDLLLMWVVSECNRKKNTKTGNGRCVKMQIMLVASLSISISEIGNFASSLGRGASEKDSKLFTNE